MCITVNPYCPMEQGACNGESGRAQTSGKIELKDENNISPRTQEACLELCKAYPGTTGCEASGSYGRMIGGPGTSNRGCYAHTSNITSGNGERAKYCWVFANCKKGKRC